MRLLYGEKAEWRFYNAPTGAEKNQDVIRMTAYAPLFQNSSYTAWKPNLIAFNNHQVYGIPSYHVISLMGKYRGDQVVALQNESEQKPPIYSGIPGVQCEKDGLLFRDPKINGEAVDVSKVIYGEVEPCKSSDGAASKVYRMIRGQHRHHYTGKSPEWNKAFARFRESWSMLGQPCAWAAFGTEELEEMSFEIDLKFDRDNPVTLSVWNHGLPTDVGCNEPKDPEWDVYSVRNQVWRIADGASASRVPRLYDPPLRPEEIVPIDIDYDAFHHYEIRCNHEGYSCFVDGRLVLTHQHRLHPVISASCEIKKDDIYLKLVNVEGEEKPVAIMLDCEVKSEVSIETVQAAPECVNTFDCPSAVSATSKTEHCGARRFVYRVPAHSVSVLVLKKHD